MQSPPRFELIPGPRTLYGAGSVARLGRRARALGGVSALVVTDPGLVRAGVVARVVRSLTEAELVTAVFDGVTPNPDLDGVARAVEHCARLEGERLVVGVGGGSALDVAKVCALMAPNGGQPRDYVFGVRPARPALPFIAIPTTAGTGSETNFFSVISAAPGAPKLMLGHPSAAAALALLDPELSVGAPPHVTACAGFDALTHALEGLTNQHAQPYSTALALEALRSMASALEHAVEHGEDVQARGAMLVGAHLAGLAFGSAGLGIAHALGHPIGNHLHVAHGQTLAALLPAVVRYNAGAVGTRYGAALEALGFDASRVPERDAEALATALDELARRVGLGARLSELGVTPALVPALVEDALRDPLLLGAPRPLDAPSAARVYFECMY